MGGDGFRVAADGWVEELFFEGLQVVGDVHIRLIVRCSGSGCSAVNFRPTGGPGEAVTRSANARAARSGPVRQDLSSSVVWGALVHCEGEGG